MSVSLKLALNYIKNNKKRAIITSITIIISTLLITTILLFLDSYKEYIITSERNKSNWEVLYNGISYEEACLIEKHSNVKEISIMSKIGDTVWKGTGNFNVPISVIGFDKNAMKNLVSNSLSNGRLPENSNEVVCRSGYYEIGDKFTAILNDGKEENYIVVGIINDTGSFIEQTSVLTLLDRGKLNNSDIVNITILSNNVKEIYNDYFDIYYKLSSYRNKSGSSLDNMTKYNKTLLEYEGVFDYVSDFQKDIYMVEGIFIGIIVISSLIFIYSVINISIIERKHYFGILKSVGTTVKQMRRSIKAEIFIILLTSIPLGIFLGIGIDTILITIVNKLFPEASMSYISIMNIFETNEKMTLAIPISTIALVIIIVCFTVYLASIVPIRKISNIQAINMIKNNRKEIKKYKNKNKVQNKITKNIERKTCV